MANQLVAQLLLLDSDDHNAPVDLYINSLGGSLTDGLAIIDAMQCLRAPIRPVCIGQAASMAAWILAAGARGQRLATPNAEVMIHQASTGLSGQTEDIQIYAERMKRLQDRLIEMLAAWTGQTRDRIRADMQRDFYMTAEPTRLTEACMSRSP